MAELLEPYTEGLAPAPSIHEKLGLYLDLLLRWNAKMNLTAVRDPEQIVTRHFGESLFAGAVLFSASSEGSPVASASETGGNQTFARAATTLADFGSGAGFPGLPIKIAFPQLQVTLLESQNKKATFLKEVIRTLKLEGAEVYSGRAEQWGKQADVVTLRAVERFHSVLPIARELVAAGGRLCLLIGIGQKAAVIGIRDFSLQVERTMPERPDTALIVGKCV